jgi:hypothetical protein
MFSGRTATSTASPRLPAAAADAQQFAGRQLHAPGAAISPLIRFDTPVKFATNRFSGLL